MTMNDLPNEILGIIFAKATTSIAELLTYCNVCPRWKDTIEFQARMIMRHIRVKYNDLPLSPQLSPYVQNLWLYDASNIPLLDLRYLRELNLRRTNVDDGIYVALTQHCAELTTLNLSETGITDAGLTDIAKNCKELRHVSLDLTMIGDDGIIALARNCRALTTLSAMYNRRISDDCIDTLCACSKLEVAHLNPLTAQRLSQKLLRH